MNDNTFGFSISTTFIRYLLQLMQVITSVTAAITHTRFFGKIADTNSPTPNASGVLQLKRQLFIIITLIILYRKKILVTKKLIIAVIVGIIKTVILCVKSK